MRIGVVIPTYNRQQLVLEALQSVLAQTRAADRVVVVDDGSVDETVARVRDWIGERAGTAHWEVVPLARNGGVSAARNAGLARIDDCELVSFLDSDDLWPPEMLERVASAAVERPESVAYVVDRLNTDFTRDREPWMQRFDWIENLPVERLIRFGCPGPSCVVMRRATLLAIGGWDAELRYMEDFDAMARLSLAGPIAHVPGVVIHYRLGVGVLHGEQKALSQSHSDRGLHRANAVERFRSAHRYPGLTQERAFCWFRAGRSAYRQRNWAECQERCVRSLRIAPWYPRPALLWLRARIRQFFPPGAATA
jgi:glycosyltransferase involved in cell wall biosynthesis